MNSSIATEEIRLSVPWGYISGKAWGKPNDERVLVVHGTLDNAGSFDRILPLLPKNNYYVVVDLPGHGLSSAFPSGIQLDYFNYILAIRIILDKLKWENCIYIGHSFGAQLGILTSILYPGRITRIACLDGFLPGVPKAGQLLELLRAYQKTTLIANETTASPPLHSKEEIIYALKCKRQFPLNSAAAEALFVRGTTKIGDFYKYNRDYRLRTPLNPLLGISYYVKLLSHLKIPVFIVLAESSWLDDNYDADVIDSLKKMISENYTIVQVRGNHDVHNNNPEIVAPHLCNFLNNKVKSKL